MKQSLILVILIGCVSSPSGSTVDASSVLDLPEIMAKDAQEPPDLPMAMDHTVTMDHTITTDHNVSAADRVSTTEAQVLDLALSDGCVPTPERCNNLDDDCDGRVDEPEDADAACVVPQGRGTCIAGRCYLASCDADRGDCDRDLSNGCETDLTRTLDHCGACGRRCGGFDACVTSVCGPMTDVDVGLNHACAVHSTGRVLCWGRNDWGQLGDGTRVDSARPVLVRDLAPASVVRAGDRYSCALSRDRRHVYCWGKQHLGDDPARTSVLVRPSELVPTVDPNSTDVRAVPDGTFVALIVGPQRLYASYGLATARSTSHIAMFAAPGSPRVDRIDGPRVLETFNRIPQGWSPVSVEDMYNGERIPEAPHILVSDATCDRLWAYSSPRWELCRQYLLRDDRVAEVSVNGFGTYLARLTLNGHFSWNDAYFWPSVVDGEDRTPVFMDRLAGGDQRLCGLIRGESSWHCGTMSALTWTLNRRSFLPRAVTRLRLFHQGDGGCYLTEGGRVFCWGDNTYGRLGDGTTLPRSEPVPMLGR